MRTMLLAGLMAVSMPAMSEKLTIERIFDDPAVLGTTPRGLKISPDGARDVPARKGRRSERARPLGIQPRRRRDAIARRALDLLQPAESSVGCRKATRERQRIAGLKGIVNYRWAPDGQRLLFPLAGQLFLYDLAVPPAQAVRSLTPKDAEVIDAQVAANGRYVSFVSRQNLWVVDLENRPQAAADR